MPQQTIDNISKVLYKYDPARTGCNFNNVKNEYNVEAEAIFNMVIENEIDTSMAITDTFNKYFHPIRKFQNLDLVISEIREIIFKH